MAKVRLEPAATSYNRNALKEFKESGVPMRAIAYTFGGGLSLAIVIPRLIGISGDTVEASVARFVIGFIIVAMTGMISFRITASPRYDMEGLDRMLIKILERFGKKPVRLAEENFQQRILDNEPRLYTALGVEVIIFRVQAEDPLVFLTKLQSLISYAVDGVRIRHYRVSEKTSVRRKLPVAVYAGQLYISLEIVSSIGDSEQIRSDMIMLMEGFGERLTRDEIQVLTRNIVAPTRELAPYELSEGIFPSPIRAMHAAAMLHLGDIEDRALVLSMARLPRGKVGPDLQRLYSILSRRPGVVTTIVEGQPPKNPIGEQYRRNIEADDQGVDVKTLRKERGTDANVRISVHAIVHGTKKELASLRRDLEREYSMLAPDQRPFFAADGAYLEEILGTILPGASNRLPLRRRFDITELREAAFYAPWPVDAGDKKGAILEMRTIENFLFFLKLYFDAPLFVWGRAGSGKSMMLSAISLNFTDIALEQKKRVGRFNMESGGTQAFERDRSDLSVTLDQDAAGRWQPLSFRILEYFFSLEDKGIDALKGWLKTLLGIDLQEVLSEAIRILLQMRDAGELRLCDLYRRLDACRAGLEAGEIKTALSKHLMILHNYCALPQSQYGHIFDPDTVKPHNYRDVWSIYVSQTPAPKQESELTTAFYNLGLAVYHAFESRFVPTPGKEAAELLAVFDELANLFKHKALTRRQIRDVNTQGRKEGKKIVMSSQELSDLVGDDEDLIPTFGHFMAADAGPVGLIVKTRQGLSPERQGVILSTIEDALSEVNSIRMKKQGWAWVYIGDVKRTNAVRVVMLDVTKNELWRAASDFPARRLRSAVQQRFGMSHDQASLMLALHGPEVPPREDDDEISTTAIEALTIYEQIEAHKNRP